MTQSALFLTPDELEALTGYKSRARSRQVDWLKAHGYKYTLNARLHVVVARAHVEAKLGGGQPAAPEPDFSVFAKSA